MVRPVDQETIAIEKIVCDSQVPRVRSMPYYTTPHREILGSVRRLREQRGNVGFIVVFKERNRLGIVSSLRIG